MSYLIWLSAKMMNLSTEPMDISVIKREGDKRLIVSAYCRSASKFVGVVTPGSPSTEINQTEPIESLMPYDKLGNSMAKILKNRNQTIAIINVESCGCSGKLKSNDGGSSIWQNVGNVTVYNALVQGGSNSFR